jgi:hypothetical protein
MVAQKLYLVKVTATDDAGNSTTATRNVIYDTTAPLLTLDPRTSTSMTTITGSVEPGSTLVVSGVGVTPGLVPTRTAGWYSFNVTGTSIDWNTVQVVATDAAGNTSSRLLNAAKPDGDLNADIKTSTPDVGVCLAIAAKIRTATVDDLTHGDIGPLNASLQPNPDGAITVVDCQLILQKVYNASAW